MAASIPRGRPATAASARRGSGDRRVEHDNGTVGWGLWGNRFRRGLYIFEIGLYRVIYEYWKN